jgi:hypothetical protein
LSLEFYVKVRDGAQMIADAAQEQIESMEPKEPETTTTVLEANFDLNFTEYSSPKLGKYEVTEEKANNKEKFLRALNILKQSNATIRKRYHGESYQFGYWIYGEPPRIYRKKLKK